MTQPHPHLTEILHAADAQVPVATIATRLAVSESTVYALLRTHRPARKRNSRRRTSAKRPMVLGLLAAGIPPVRVALLAQVTRAWVHALVKDEARRTGGIQK